VTDPLTPFAGANSYSLFDLAAGWNVNPALRVTAGIDNLFDRDPNAVGAGPADDGAGNTMPGFYDVLGRRYYAALRLRF
jgi:outer membrane receptor protein involved in Fe transport